MDLDAIKTYCAAKKAVTSDFPFDFETLVYRVAGKIFALMPSQLKPGEKLTINLKCDPSWAEILRQTYPGVVPGYHMNKQHWNTVSIDGTIPDDEIMEMIDHSYEQVVKGLTKKQKEFLVESKNTQNDI
jgi:predicted DNA-binding protein (MmcQ/YjbR family)